jgi:phosphoribosyl-dephospho-CoA transferase
MVGLTRPRPHDLLRLFSPLDVVPEDAPAWVAVALRAAPWVVVRRATASAGRVPVGVRGKARAHRFAMEIHGTAAAEVLAPQDLTARVKSLKRALPVTRALQAVSTLLDESALPWGPTGSVGFELASGTATANADSDLDLLIRPTRLPTRAKLRDLHAAFQRLPARVDCQIETDAGAVALGELVSGTRELLLRTANGPRLIPAPWPAAA